MDTKLHTLASTRTFRVSSHSHGELHGLHHYFIEPLSYEVPRNFLINKLEKYNSSCHGMGTPKQLQTT